MAKKNKLRCFYCGLTFKKKEDIFRNDNNEPRCRDCLFEELMDIWDDEFLDGLIDEVEKNYNRNYRKWKKWFDSCHRLCDGPCKNHVYDEQYFHFDQLIEKDGLFYCEDCIEDVELEEACKVD